jgi:hypothetical protein
MQKTPVRRRPVSGSGNHRLNHAGRIVIFLKTLLLVLFFTVVLPVYPSCGAGSGPQKISEIIYTEKDIQELSPIAIEDEIAVQTKVDELIDLLESHKRAVAEGHEMDGLQETVHQINQLIEQQKAAPARLSMNDFYRGICFECHAPNDFSPSDKTRKEWRYLIEDDGHMIFDNIPWETPWQKKQVLEFLLENAGNHRAEGIGLWN